MDRKPLLFSQSNAYFPYEEMLQTSIGFANPLDIDTYIKQSFGLLTDTIMLTGAEVQCFTKDHLIDEHFICYKIEGINQKPVLITDWKISCNLIKQWFFKSGLIQWLIQGTPILSLCILSLLTRIAPPKIANILMYISLIGLLITCCFYGFKLIKGLIKTIFSKEIDYDGIGITYEKETDHKLVHTEFLKKIEQLEQIYKIDKLVLFQGNIFFKQTINKKTVRQSIKEKFSRTSTNSIQSDNTTKIQQTVSWLLDQNLFM